ncbi:MAG: helix-turn-helix domain-containing protein [Methylacidiphilales bacterium]|nr:helix-turn-helix domain-containing protein [Candidatus Methylacidiphilales bacterium]
MLEDLKIRSKYDGFLYLIESVRNPPKLNSHHHVELELNVVVRGSITYVAGGRRFTFARRTLLWMFPTQEHQLVDRSDDAQCYVAVFKPELIARSCRSKVYADLRRKRVNCDGVLHTVLEPESFDLIRKTMDSLMQGALDPDVLNREAGFGVGSDFCFEHGDPEGLNAGLHHLMLLCWRTQRTGKALGDAVTLHPAVRHAVKLLSEGTQEEDLGQLAKACGVSGAYLSRKFRRQIGVPLSRYRNSLRISRFWEEYRQPEQKTLTEAVYAAGFGSYAQFYKVFTQTYGHGPRRCLERGAKVS